MSTDLPPLGTYTPADIPWATIEARLRAAFHYWLSTTRPDGRPHAVPIWGVWEQGAFYFYTEPQTQKARNLAAHPAAVVHLESADDVIIVEGPTSVVPEADEQWRQVEAALFDKYKDPDSGAGLRLSAAPRPPVVYRLQPRHVRAWAHGNSFAQAHWHFG
ncbi:MAG TPA: pyridoxamine 5'-phosphate oxidase family protein [Chloroflexia bacterium]|nr:pyridoxamine 5'-phosphate oxidase family protein [Chloroflexia bacterium]